MKATVYNQDGDESKSVELPEAVLGRSWNPDLVHQVVVGMQANARNNVAHVKDRSEVSGGGTKPWRQKGTGRARHGSIRSPIWAGGGQSFGPIKEKDYSKKLNTRMKREALLATLTRKYKEGEVLFIDELSFDEPKTAEAKDVLEKLSEIEGFDKLKTKRDNAALIAAADYNENAYKSFRNFGNIVYKQLENINVLDLLEKKYCIITGSEESVEILKRKVVNTKAA